ncbi:MAG: hypothetical protein ACLT21_04330, partial [Oscillospiraceae bacterium]
PSGALFVHCLIYKIHAPHPRNRFIVPRIIRFVKTFLNFFKVFWKPQRRVTHSFDRIPDLAGNVNPFFAKT